MKSTSDEAQLISACRLGEADAWVQVWRRYYGLVAHLVRSSGFFKPHEVEEICQEVFVNLLDALQRFEGRGTLKSLLRVIAKRRVADAVRRRVRRGPAIGIVEESEPGDRESGVQLRSEAEQRELAVLSNLRLAVSTELEGLSQDCQALIQFRYRDGLKLREIAGKLDRPLGSVGTQLQRCMTRLHEACLMHDSEIQAVEPLLESWVIWP